MKGQAMYCPTCGVKSPEESTVCIKCGQILKRVDAGRRISAPGRQREKSFRGAAVTNPRTDRKAIAGLIFGILYLLALGLLFVGVLSVLTILSLFLFIPAAILGNRSRLSIRESLGELKGENIALVGIIIGNAGAAITTA